MTMHYKAAKQDQLCGHEHRSRDSAATCPVLGDGPGVVVFLGPKANLKRLALQARDPEDEIKLGGEA